MNWTLVECCCGSAALSLYLTGAPRPLVPYQGSKWGLCPSLGAVLTRLGYWGAPYSIVLSDVGPFAAMATVLRSPREVEARLASLVAEGERDPQALYARLHLGETPSDPCQYAAELLWLQRMAFSGKAVGEQEGRWVAPGLNVTSALGVAATERFGEVKPLGKALLRAMARLKPFDDVHSVKGTATPREGAPPTVVLIDPPYVGTTGYPCGDMPRDEVVSRALEWHTSGAAVIVCEAEPLDELVRQGWRAQCLQEGSGKQRGSTPSDRGWEWITYRLGAT